MFTASMATWRNGLWSELFDDPTGDGRPVSIIHIDDTLFARAINRQGFAVSATAARAAFLKAFPDRLNVQRWLAGSENPGNALLPLLTLCCLAASEAADSDENDYRGRMRDLMGWNERIINCASLPQLWLGLARLTVKRAEQKPTRPLILPDPRFRTQIGHAIELTFPSRIDARRLTQELAGETFDLEAPRAVLAWLAPLVTRGRFSSTFVDTFNDFREAWLSAERALADHRFWSGWRLATQAYRDAVTLTPFEIVADEWGGRHLIDPASETGIDLELTLRSRTFPASLAASATRNHIIPLVESEWGKLRWIGNDRGRSPSALLIRQRAWGSRYAPLRCVPVSGASGWGLTFNVSSALSERDSASDRDRLLDVAPTNCTRVDGGVLARPALPFLVETTGFVASVSLVGDRADQLTITKISAGSWRITPNVPVEGEVRVIAEPRGGGANLERVLRLRRSVLAPSFREVVPDRLFDADPPPAPDWPFVAEADATTWEAMPPAEETKVSPALLDLIEYLAIRTAPIPIGALIDIVRAAIGEAAPNPWDVLQSLRDAGVVRILDVRGWRGRVVLSRPPRGALVRRSAGWSMIIEGCTNETWIGRLEASASHHGLKVEERPGVGEWSPPTFMVLGSDLQVLREIARSIETPTDYLSPGLKAVATLLAARPIAAAPPGVARRNINIRGRHAPLTFLNPVQANVSALWEVGAGEEMRCWKSRDDAIIDAYLTVGARPFDKGEDRMQAGDARLPIHVTRWIRLVAGVAAGPLDDGYGYAWNPAIEREMVRLAPVFFGKLEQASGIASSPLSRRWAARAYASPVGPRVASVWNVARGGR